MKLFDLHCDTALELYLRKQPLKDGTLHISLEKAKPFDTHIQTMAYWCSSSLSDEDAYARFWDVSAHLQNELELNNIPIIRTKNELIETNRQDGRGVILAIEDARLLAGDLSRLDTLYAHGVRFLTLTWGGETCIGGSHDTDAPLTSFGRGVVERAFELGIIPDLSHASRKITAEVLEMASHFLKPVIATHSNSYAVREHTRNLTDAEFTAIVNSGGIVGISMAPSHLANENCGIPDIVKHIQHYLALGGEDALCLGCDFDGIGSTPKGMENISCLPSLYTALIDAGISEKIAQKIFFENAFGFTAANI